MCQGVPTRASHHATVAGCGAVSLDDILFLDRGWDSGKGRVLRRETVHGGNIATALMAVRSLGGNARWLGYLPSGEAGGSVRLDFLSHGIDLDFATPTAAEPIRSTILVDPDGERGLVGFLGPAALDRGTQGVGPSRPRVDLTAAISGA